ncbi:MAG TPA: four helix bundle protein [Gemmatimonadaceae bacterium]
MRDTNKLRVAETAMVVAEATYRVTREFPPDERWGLVSQMRRAAVSIGSNIAEGCGRSTNPQFVAFLQIAMGSASELEYQARLSLRLNLSSGELLNDLITKITSAKGMLGKLTATQRG